MPILISAHQLSKSFAARPLFSGLTFSIESNDRIGLIGPNGAGKSTLLRILAGRESLDQGTLSLQKGLVLGYLEQIPSFSDDARLLNVILEGTDDPHDWQSQALAQELIAKCGLDSFPPDALIRELSGGWKKRIALARELAKKPDLLLLDEPTNHLDVESILWLEKTLARAPYATLTITHDRLFLQRVSNRIVELNPRYEGGLLSVAGDYSRYLEVRESLISAQEKREVVLQNTLRRETEWLRRGAKARTTKQQARIQRHGELSEEAEDLSARNQTRAARLDFQSSVKNPKKLLEAKGISKTYGSRQIFAPLDLTIRPGSRIGLLGQNGAGKSTLIQVLLGHEEPSSGEVFRSEHLSVAYFDQTRQALDPRISLMKTLCPSGDSVHYRGASVHIRSYLDRFLFTSAQMDMAVGKLSGGEQSRLLLARLMLTPANLMVLDEPTNDLDMATLGVLEDCLTDFEGAILLVTHDRYFLDQIADQILAFPPLSSGSAQLLSFAGWSQWEDWHLQNEKTAPQRKHEPPPSVAETPRKKRKLSFNEQRELDGMEARIQSAEERLAKLSEESALPAHASDAKKLAQLASEMAQAQAEVARLYERWSNLEGGS